MRTVVSLFDFSGNMVKPWAENGHECLCIDTKHSIRADRTEAGVTYRWGDVRSLEPTKLPEPSIIFAFPPCTHLTVSGARDWERRGLAALIDALQLIEAARRLCEWYGCPWMLENPVGRLANLWRKPDYMFNPYHYGDPYTKKTCIWASGGFVMPTIEPVTPTEGSKMHLMPPGPDRQANRSATPAGFAAAVYKANKEVVS